MEQVTSTARMDYRELVELLETASFSLETVRMALAIGRRAGDGMLSLDDRLRSTDQEERESGVVALEALDHARAAFLDLAHILDEEQLDGLGLSIRFWSTFEWCWAHLFTEPVRTTGQNALRFELCEARSRTTNLQSRLQNLGLIDVPELVQ